ncbi:MAG: DUF2399 domain-containing protein [Cellulosilyticum sp.]|nr:DUF2399 domain-containing protein [Cellulosilyticum sp.]
MREKELADYLKQNKGYQNILEKIIERYRRLGKLGGTIVLGQLTEEEVKILSPYDYRVSETKTCKITVKKFVKGLCRGKFEGVDFEETLRLYSGEALISNKEVKEKKQETTEQFYKQLIEKLNCNEVQIWLTEALEKKAYGYYTFHKLYPNVQEQLKEMIMAIDDLVSYRKINQDWILLPVLASLITRDTHYFDLNKIEGKLLLYYFAYKQGVPYPESVQAINEVLMEEGIVRDQLSNSTICYGIYGKTERYDKPWDAFWKMGEPLQLSLYNLKDVCEMTAKRQRVYIVENPAVFSGLLEVAIQKEVGLICTSGQLNTSSYMILDLLASNYIMMYYNGDFDPEGLQIADKLKQRYPKLHLWCYDVADYLKIKGQVQIEERINKLNHIQSEGLKVLAMQMKKEKTAGYQELLLERLIQSIE